MMDITLALGGGGVKGFAHIGVIRTLERSGFRIRSIAGTSIGGLVAAIYGAGIGPEGVEERLAAMDQSRLYNRLPGDRPSLLGLGGVIQVLKDYLGDKAFEDLRLPVAMTAVDLESGQAVVMRRGRVLDAVLATIAVPGIFPPKVWEGRLMVDGGIVDPVPVALARTLAPNLPVVAVALTPAVREWNGNQPAPRLLRSIPLLNRLYQMRLAQSFAIFLRSVEIGGSLLANLRLQIDRPEIVIRPKVAAFGLVDTVDMTEMVRLGEEATQEVLPELRQLFTWQRRWSSRLPEWIGQNRRSLQ
ncbi:MAG: hypothetical protein EHM70_06630 [Chloroflexota bacterium]|nr:MAG: hypothetical protein EHM70_06630 [Chloroflexota bacterium]